MNLEGGSAFRGLSCAPSLPMSEVRVCCVSLLACWTSECRQPTALASPKHPLTSLLIKNFQQQYQQSLQLVHLCCSPVWVSSHSVSTASTEEALHAHSAFHLRDSGLYPFLKDRGQLTGDHREGALAMWSMSFRGGTVGMPSKGNSIVAISSKTSACRTFVATS